MNRRFSSLGKKLDFEGRGEFGLGKRREFLFRYVRVEIGMWGCICRILKISLVEGKVYLGRLWEVGLVFRGFGMFKKFFYSNEEG